MRNKSETKTNSQSWWQTAKFPGLWITAHILLGHLEQQEVAQGNGQMDHLSYKAK